MQFSLIVRRLFMIASIRRTPVFPSPSTGEGRVGVRILKDSKVSIFLPLTPALSRHGERGNLSNSENMSQVEKPIL
jgi:hypothetical protein